MLVAAVAVGGYGPAAAPAGMQAAGKPYAGTTLRVLLANHPWAVAIKPLRSSFEKATGMTVKMFSIVLATNRTKTLPVAIYTFISYAQIDWGGLMAAVVITVPVLVLALLTQRFIVRGLTAGAVKG